MHRVTYTITNVTNHEMCLASVGVLCTVPEVVVQCVHPGGQRLGVPPGGGLAQVLGQVLGGVPDVKGVLDVRQELFCEDSIK